MNFAVDDVPGFFCKLIKTDTIDVLSVEKKINPFAVAAQRKIAGDVCLVDRTQLFHHLFDKLVEPYVFPDNVADVIEQRMLRVCPEDLPVHFHAGNKQAGFLETVKLNTNGIG